METALLSILFLASAPLDPGMRRPSFAEPRGHTARAPEGHFTLRWRMPSGAKTRGLRFELQQAPTARFHRARTRYLGPDRAVFLSGLPAGDAHFRVRAVRPGGTRGAWSRTVVVRVRYVSWRLVIGLMILGAVLLLATVGVILVGHRRARAVPREGPDA